jgi:hypothetical protein
MLNLNYNINNTQVVQRGEEKLGFTPYVNTDPYSSSLVVAIPGQIFYQGYNPLFGATDKPYYDVSSYVKGTGTPYTLLATGSNSSEIKGKIGTPWDRYGYTSSLLMPPLAAIDAGTSSAFLITSASEWVVEAWVSFPTASNATNPSHFLLNKVANFGNTDNTGNSYSVGLGSFTKVANPNDGNYPTNTGPYPVSGGLFVQIFNSAILQNYSYSTYWPQSEVSSSFLTGSWHHLAVSMEIVNPYGTFYAQYNGFVDGNLVMQQYYNIPSVGAPSPIPTPNDAPNQPMLLMGNLYDYTQLQLNPIGTPDTWITASAAVFQDFRFYKGTNKNYTASFDVNNTVQPIVIARPY